MPLILPGNVASATAVAEAYDVDNSVRLDDNGHFTRMWDDTVGGITWTLSLWFKRGAIDGANQTFMSCKYSGLDKSVTIRINSDDKIQYLGNYYGANRCNLITSAVFRDPSAWIHLVVGQDSSEATEGDRLKFWINGSRVTAFDTETYYAQNQNDHFNESSTEHQIGAFDDGDEFQGYFAQFCFLHGVQYDADQFGEFDSSSPTVWKPIDISGIATDESGFFLDFADSDNLGDDESGNTDGANDWTAVNLDATDQATDTPTNNFCTMNPLNQRLTNPAAFSQGNCQMTTSGSWGSWSASMGSVNGKWYWEAKRNGSAVTLIGILSENATKSSDSAGNNSLLGNPAQYQGVGYHATGTIYPGSGGESGGWGAGYSANDIISVAMDLDNGKLYFAINGTWSDSGDPTSGATGTGSAKDLTVGTEFFFPSLGSYTDGEGWSGNFGGCSSFTVSSANQDANGYGNFEYAVPSGYYALCSKNLAEFG